MAQPATPALLPRVDHLVYATPDLARGVDEIERLIGVRASPGGRHPGLGTRNALVALGQDVYLEIIAPDPDQPKPPQPRRFGLDTLTVSRLVTWAAKGTDLERLQLDAERIGVALGKVALGSRRRPDGVELTWRATSSEAMIADGIVPFFIDWGESPHPSSSASRGAFLVALRAGHPDASGVRRMLDKLALPLVTRRGAMPALVATIDGPRGRVELR